MQFVTLLRRPVVWTVIACAAVVLFLVLRPASSAISPVVWTEPSANPLSKVLQPGEAAPDFALPTVEGGMVALSTLQGKSALLVFVNAECPYCEKLNKELEAFELNADQQLVFICTGEEGARKISETYSFTYPVLIDSAGAVSQAYKTPGVPTVYQINAQGNVVDLVVGWPPAWEFVRDFGRAQPSEGS
ncbi:MAG: TlpA family protein disulfide reductase [Gemmatimonadetes bacterium]|nr:TlpA family protein disulfide reductase [Gemmatimonadota bacterium]MYB71206.1 TlpA family protein disulfide reductase [Gemmatimonadota bacterium]